ncbi:response regulator receiver domain protein [Streptomyces venezuelae]|uniref:response regulator n=1 Tax=Streptomyces gardneri TaxID=66892 RepID=UPI0006BCC772|nr:response regulator transcription factor [Streptomyces gardneri]ALO06460.1 response regulator receiver domain protein [Streptomyces venezuelae]QPK43899.1 response regulator transcription factor [Streptomyces gardneri]WRK35161.1 response regulator transcription factor [Streptomyces venezuelae]CUM43272.1 DNA-binding response regulator, LuxR family [Streptomyces venezuelae]
MIRVLLADDQELVRAGIRLVLKHADDIEVVAEASDGHEATVLATRHEVDVAMLDIQMQGADGLRAAERIAERAPSVRVVMLTTFGEHAYVERALKAGVSGFLLKDSTPQELIQAVRRVAAGDPVVSPQITRHLIDRYLDNNEESADPRLGRIARLTDREREVLAMVGTGASNAEIGRRLHLGEGTVKAYVSRMLTKLSCSNRVQAAILAHDARLLQGER